MTSNEALIVPMKKILRVGAMAFLLVPVITAVLFSLGQNAAGWGVLLGGGIPWVFFGVTAITALRTANVNPNQLGAIVLGSWLLKIIALLGVLAWMRGQDFYSRSVFFITLLIATIGLLVTEAQISLKAKVPYVG
ncbi:MAG: hypothetical protein RLZZ330_1086 [Actinomycetota bacterium]|jgi:hypothetical protein